jgi:hypothetical protein
LISEEVSALNVVNIQNMRLIWGAIQEFVEAQWLAPVADFIAELTVISRAFREVRRKGAKDAAVDPRESCNQVGEGVRGYWRRETRAGRFEKAAVGADDVEEPFVSSTELDAQGLDSRAMPAGAY